MKGHYVSSDWMSCLRMLLITVMMFYAIASAAQVGGQNSFEFLNVNPSARAGGLGGVNVSLADADVNFLYSNPALTGDTLLEFASVNYQFYVADIGYAAITYGNEVKKVGPLFFGIQHMNYGTFKGFDAGGVGTEDFRSSETALSVATNRSIGAFRYGVTLKGIFSSIAGHRATAIAADLGGLFIKPDRSFTAGLVIRNLGVTLSSYSKENRHSLPLDVQFGATIKPTHMPVRVSLTAFNLVSPDALYDDPAVQESDTTTLDRILGHVNFGGEILLSKNVNILIGYNFLNHQALKLENAGGGAGLTFGFSARIKSVDFVFSRIGYMAGSAAYAFTISANTRKFF